MDQMLRSVVEYTGATDYASLSADAVSRVVRHTADTFGCGAGGFDSRPARIARQMAIGASGPLVASVYGQPEKALVDAATFANVSANRNLDFNDFGLSGHPSDMIAALFAMAEATRATGPDVIGAVHLAYEIATALAEASPLSERGWDQGLYCSIAAAAAMARLLRLDADQTANAVSLALVPSVPLRATRSGELSEWKGSATAHALMTASFAVRLAARGMSGPPDPFEGKDGLFDKALPPFKVTFGAPESRTSAIERASLKRYPACFWGQTGIEAMLRLRAEVDPSRVRSVEVATCHAAFWVVGGGRGDAAEKWNPPTRETADHSLPYMLAVALLDGLIDDDSFSDQRREDAAVRAATRRIQVTESQELTRRAGPDICPTQVTVITADGLRLTEVCDIPRGHPDNPMTDDEVHDKFDGLVARVLPPAPRAELADRLWGLQDAASLDPIGRLLRSFSVQ
jgi:2-methylcitrate dehydratase